MQILDLVFADDECVKINTGAAVPTHADAIVQVEDTVLLSEVLGVEQIVDIRVQPVKNTDIRCVQSHLMTALGQYQSITFFFRRPIGSDLAVGSRLFRSETYPGHVAYKSLLASVGVDVKVHLSNLWLDIPNLYRSFQCRPHRMTTSTCASYPPATNSQPQVNHWPLVESSILIRPC